MRKPRVGMTLGSAQYVLAAAGNGSVFNEQAIWVAREVVRYWAELRAKQMRSKRKES